jgi:hypothetical protein
MFRRALSHTTLSRHGLPSFRAVGSKPALRPFLGLRPLGIFKKKSDFWINTLGNKTVGAVVSIISHRMRGKGVRHRALSNTVDFHATKLGAWLARVGYKMGL